MRLLRAERPLTRDQFHQLIQLSEIVVEYGQMIRLHEESVAPYVILAVPEIATRFRESAQAIEDALRLLSETGRAHVVDRQGNWKVKVTSTPVGGSQELPVTARSNNLDGDESDLGVA